MLSPAEIGVYSMTVVFVGIAHIFRDFGVATYIQREPDLTPEKMRSAIGVMFVTSWTISAILFALSQPLGQWFKEPAMVPVMRVLALGFVVIPFGSITHSLLIRELAAGKQAVVTAASTISYAVSCLTLGALGFGTMSLACANLFSLIVAALAYIPYRPAGMPWLPSFRHWRDIVHFGIGTLISSCLAEINASIPDLALGKLGSATHVGLFSRANSTVSIFRYVAGSTITYGAVSYMSQAHHRGEPLAPILSRATSLLIGVGWPAFAFTALLGADIVSALYGTKWLDCVPAITPLTIAAGVSMLFQYTPTALTAVGLPYLGAVSTAVTLLARIAFAACLFNGTIASFSWAICLATLVTAPVLVWQQRRHFGFGVRAFLQSLLPSAGVTAICMVACEGMRLLLPDSLPALVRLGILAVPLTLSWYLALRITKHELVGEVHHLVGGLISRLTRAPT
jgi:O-antigen/teichoic acid export membrane protein